MRITRLRRREFLVLAYGVVAWPLAARAQHAEPPVIGFLDGQSSDQHLLMAFRQALKDAGYVEGKNVAIAYRFADGHTDRLLTLAGDLVDRRVAVIVATGGTAAANAAYAATTTIPIVFASTVDPIISGLITSLNRPGGNATGVYVFQQVLEGKRLGLLRELVPTAVSISVLLNPTNASFQTQLTGVQEAASAAGQRLIILSASTERDIDAACEDNRNCCGCCVSGVCRGGATRRDDHGDAPVHQISSQSQKSISVTARGAVFDRHVSALDVAGVFQGLAECHHQVLVRRLAV